MKIIQALILNKEARLFDTKEFLLKTFVAVLLGSFVGRAIPYVSKDMISLLFGMMLTLDPVNLTGIRNGFKQVEATLLGAVVTGLILAAVGYIPGVGGALGGYTPWAVALAVTATLYISLLIDWRNFSVVAVFTSIYMTQYVQLDAAGNPSEIETFKLRIAALLSGVIIALFVNFLFSVFGYRHMLEKRIYHLLDDLSAKMDRILKMIKAGDYEETADLMAGFPSLFNNIDWINGTIMDFRKDPFIKRGQNKQVKLEKIQKMATLVREMTHINYDICYRLSKGIHNYREEGFEEAYERTAVRMTVLRENLDAIIHNRDVHGDVAIGGQDQGIYELDRLNENIEHINQLLMHYSKV